jgi:hypothetical protein
MTADTVEDRLAGIKTWLEFARTPGPESRPPRTEAEIVEYLGRLNDFVGRLLPDVDWLIAELERRLRGQFD